MNEIWKDIKGYEGLYQISNLGRVRNKKGRILKQSFDGVGYYKIKLCNNCHEKTILIHRLVATNFLANPNNYKCVDHINTIRTDNRLENLRWCTTAENNCNVITKNKRAAYYRVKPILQFDINGRYVNRFSNSVDAGNSVHVNCNKILECCRGERKSIGGYLWAFEYVYLQRNVASFINKTASVFGIEKCDSPYNTMREIEKYIDNKK